MKEITELPRIPDEAYDKGVSAPFCGMLGDRLVVAGGANFPDKPLLEGGAKRVYDDIWACDGAAWERIGNLPDSTAYGATFQLSDGLVFAGGSVKGTPSEKVFTLSGSGLERLPDLPCGIQEAGAAYYGGLLILAGGMPDQVGHDENNGAGIYACREGEYEWARIGSLPEPMVQPVAYLSGDRLFIWGGFNPSTLKLPKEGWVYRIQNDAAEIIGTVAYPDGGTFVGSAGIPVKFSGEDCLAVIGGVDRAIFSKALHNTPEDRIPYLSKEPAEYRFRSTVWIFNPSDESWSPLKESPEFALAGPGAAYSQGTLYIAGGELKPGVRSPKIISLQL